MERCTPLTPAMIRTLRLAAQGRQCREIAADLNLKPKTVQDQLSRAYIRLDVNNRIQAIRRATELGILP